MKGKEAKRIFIQGSARNFHLLDITQSLNWPESKLLSSSEKIWFDEIILKGSIHLVVKLEAIRIYQRNLKGFSTVNRKEKDLLLKKKKVANVSRIIQQLCVSCLIFIK